MKIPVSRPVAGRLLLVSLVAGLVACSSPPAGEEMPAEEEAAEPVAAGNGGPSWNRVASLLKDGQVVFGIFSGERTPETAMEMAQQELADFIFYSLERGPFDLPTMSAYQEALSPPDARGSANPHPVLLRIPPIRDGMDEAAERTAAGLDAGVYGIVFPHVETAEEARHAVASMTLASAGGLRGDADSEAARVFGVSPEDYAARAGVWPLDPAGELVSFLLIEDKDRHRERARDHERSGHQHRFAGSRRSAARLRGRHGGGGGSDPDRAGRLPRSRRPLRHHRGPG